MPKRPSKRFQLSADVGRLIKLVGAQLNPRREAILGELIRNSDDALQLRQFRDPSFSSASGRITIAVGHSSARLSIRDNGIGISREELEVLLISMGHVADAALRHDSIPIGEFGIGFLSYLAIAESLEMTTQAASDRTASIRVLAEPGASFFTVSQEAANPEPGTTISLILNAESLFLIDRHVLEQLIRTECRYVTFPIYINDDAQPTHNGRQPSLPPRPGSDAGLAAAVAAALRQAGLQFDQEASVGGVRPDFLVYGPRGQNLILEVKTWEPTPGNLSRALTQLDHYKTVTGADGAFVVFRAAPDPGGQSGIVRSDRLIEAIQPEFGRLQGAKYTLKPVAIGRPIVFAAMPFTAEYDDLFLVAMSYAADEVGTACVRVDREEFSGDIVTKIQDLIRQSLAVIADLSESRPNVLYETGYAHALVKPTVHLCSTPLASLRFDIHNWSTLEYQRGQTYALREPLAARLKAVVGRTDA